MNINKDTALEKALEDIHSNAENFIGARWEECYEDYSDGTDYIKGIIVIPENGERWAFEFQGYEIGYWVDDDYSPDYEVELYRLEQIK